MKNKIKINSIHNDIYTTSRFAKHVKKKRSCLMCGKMFDSKGPFNRRCQKCDRLVELGKRNDFSLPALYNVALKKIDVSCILDDFDYS